MKRIVNYLFVIIIMSIIFFGKQFCTVRAEGEEPVEDAEKIVINPNSEGIETNVFLIDDEEDEEEGKEIQFTKSRDISVLIKFTDEELENYGDTYDVCEVVVGAYGNTDRCSTYGKEEKKVYFQIPSLNDGQKEIYVKFYSKNGVGGNKIIEKSIFLDTTGPVITFKDGEYMYIPVGEQYEEKKAECTDNSLYTIGDCKVEAEEAHIDMNKASYQYVRYTAKDFLGNETTALVKVLVEIKVEEEDNTMYWVGAGIGIAILSAFLFLQVWKNKEKQRNQSVL